MQEKMISLGLKIQWIGVGFTKYIGKFNVIIFWLQSL